MPADRLELLSHAIRPKYLDFASDAGVQKGRHAYVPLPKMSAVLHCRGHRDGVHKLVLLPGPTKGVWDSAGPFEEVTQLAPQSPTQLVQNVGSIHSGAIVVQPEQSRIGHAGFLSQPINRPTLLVKDFSELANDHAGRVAGPIAVCKLNHIYEVCFTYYKCRSKVAPRPRGPRALSVQWKLTATSVRTDISKTFPGLLSTANGGRT
jgi:hypothetical protein